MSTPHSSPPRLKHKSHTRRRRPSVSDFEERWGDEEPLPEDETVPDLPDTNHDFVESPAKRVKLSNGAPATLRRSQTPPTETMEEKAERERQQDLRDRDEFARRLASREADKSKKTVESKDSVTAQRRALADDTTARQAAMPDLRLRSRQDYLKKREAERLALLRKQVDEETEELREYGDELTKAEKEEFARNREVLRIAEERAKIDDHVDGYTMPEDYITERGKIDRKRKEEALYKRYVERDEAGREKFVTEHEEWEREQTRRAKEQVKSYELVDEGDYEYVFDESQRLNFLLS